MSSYPVDHRLIHCESLHVRYHGDQRQEFFRSDRKLRLCELVLSLDDNQLAMYVYKIRKPSNKLHFKLNLHEQSKVVSSNVKGEFRFCVDDDKIALFDGKSSDDRDNWEQIINTSISNLRNIHCMPICSDPQSASQNAVTQDLSRPISESQGLMDELNINVIPSALPNNGRKHVSKANHLHSCPVIESVPFRRDPRVRSSVARVDSEHQSLVLSSIASNEPLNADMSADDKENSMSAPSYNSITSFSSYSPSKVHRRGDVPQSSPIAAQKNMKARNDNHEGQQQVIVTDHLELLSVMIPGVVEVQPVTESDSNVLCKTIVHNAAYPSFDNLDESMEVGDDSTTIDGQSGQSTIDVDAVVNSSLIEVDQELIASLDDSPSDRVEDEGEGEGVEKNRRELALLKQEMEALSAMNDQLNGALESAEAMMRSRDEEHEYQLAFISRLLEQAQEESMQVKAMLKESIGLKEEADRSADDLSRRLEAIQVELDSKVNDLDISSQLVAIRDSALQSMQTAAERQSAELSALHDQLSDERRFRAIEKSDFDGQLEQLTAITQQMRCELADYEQCLTSEVVATAALSETVDPSSLSIIRQLTGALKQKKKELFDVRLSEEAAKLIKVRLERVIQEQKAYEEQLLQQVDASHEVTMQLNEAMRQIEASKEDSLRILREKETVQKECDRMQQHCQLLETEMHRQREGYEQRLEKNEADAVQWKDQIQQMASAATHSQTEISILQRRLELSKDQIAQLDQQTHELKRQQQSSDQFHLREKGALQESLDAASQVVRELQSRCRLLEELQHAEATGAKDRCQEYEDRIAELKRMNKEVHSRVAALEDQLRKSDLHLTSEVACNNSLRLTVETLERQLDTIQEANAHSVSSLELSLGKLQSSLSECNKQLRESELQRRVQLEKANAANKELSTMLSSTEASNHLLADEMNSMRAEHRDESNAMRERLDAQSTLQEALELRIDELNRLLSNAESEHRIQQQQSSTREAQLLSTQTNLTTSKEMLEAALNKLRSEHSNIQQALQAMTSDYELKTKESALLRESLDAQSQKAAQLSLEVEQLRRSKSVEIDELKTQVERMKSSLVEASGASAIASRSFGNRIESLENSLISATQNLKKVELDYSDCHSKLLEASNELYSCRNKLKESQSQLADCSDQLDDRSVQLEKCKMRLHDRDTQLDSFKTQLKDIKSQHDDCQATLKYNLDQLEARKVELFDLRALAADHKHQLKDKAAQLEDSVRELMDCKAQLNERSCQLEGCKNKSIEFRVQLEECRVKVYGCNTLLEECKTELRDRNVQLEACKSQLVDRGNQLKECKSKLSDRIALADDIEARLSEALNQLADCQQHLRTCSSQLSESQMKARDRCAVVEELKAELEDRNRHVVALTEANERQAAEISTIKEQYTKALAAHSVVQSELRAARSEVDRTTQTLSSVHRDLDQGRSMIVDLEQQISNQTAVIEKQSANIGDHLASIGTLERAVDKWGNEYNVLLKKLERTSQELLLSTEKLEQADDRIHSFEAETIPELRRGWDEAMSKNNLEHTRYSMEIGGLKRSLQAAEQLRRDLDTRITELEEYKSSSERTLNEALYDNHRMLLTLSRSLESITVLLAAGSVDGGGLVSIQAAAVSISGVSTEVFTLMSESVRELRDICTSLDAACSALAQEHHALKSSAAQLWTALSSELHAMSFDEQQINAPQPPKSVLAAAIADTPSSVRLLVQHNDALVHTLLQLFKSKISKLDSVVREQAVIKAALDVSIDEQLVKMDQMQLQIQTLTSANAASEQRHAVEVSSLKHQCEQSRSQVDSSREEFQRVLSELTASHEEQFSRQIAFINAAMDQRLAEEQSKANRTVLDLELKHQALESNLSYELEKVRREHQIQMDVAHQLRRDSAIKEQELQRLSQRLEEAQVVVGDKTQQLEDLLNQLEKAELKAAREARQRMELERSTRRFRKPSSSSHAPPDSPLLLLHDDDDEKEKEQRRMGVPPLTVDTSLATPVSVSTQSSRAAARITPRISSISRTAVREQASPIRASSSASSSAAPSSASSSSSPNRKQYTPLDSPSKHRASSTPSGAAIQKAFSATNRIEQAMQAKGWAIKASKSLH